MTLADLIDQVKEPVHILGYVGQAVFFSRFAIQWIASERRKESVIPVGFWWCSLVGGVLTLVYALMIQSPPIVLGQVFGLVVYVRNLMLVHRKRPAGAAAPEEPA